MCVLCGRGVGRFGTPPRRGSHVGCGHVSTVEARMRAHARVHENAYVRTLRHVLAGSLTVTVRLTRDYTYGSRPVSAVLYIVRHITSSRGDSRSDALVVHGVCMVYARCLHGVVLSAWCNLICRGQSLVSWSNLVRSTVRWATLTPARRDFTSGCRRCTRPVSTARASRASAAPRAFGAWWQQQKPMCNLRLSEL